MYDNNVFILNEKTDRQTNKQTNKTKQNKKQNKQTKNILWIHKCECQNNNNYVSNMYQRHFGLTVIIIPPTEIHSCEITR